MRSLGLITAWTAVFTLVAPAEAWNATGHRVVAAIAYDRLTPAARVHVDALLHKHPDLKNLTPRDAFLAAAVWPDVIKSDSRFYDDTRANAQPAPLLPGFPSMARHTNWHYIDIPFSPDGTPLEQPKSPNALEQLDRLLKTLGPKDPAATYDIPWLIHIEGDVHQPLHCSSRFVKSEPHGDQGGNLVFVTPGRNLHALWDDIVGSDTSPGYVNSLAKQIAADFVQRNGPNPKLSKNPKKWIEEGFALAQNEVYTFGPETGTRDHPIPLPSTYESNARNVARVRLAVAGFRLASVLNRRFR